MNIRSTIRRFIGLVLLLWVGLAQVMAQVYRVGDLFTAPDGSQGIVYWLNPDGSGGWVVALNDASAGCAWGEAGDIPGLDNQNPGSSNNRPQLLYDTAGYAHTQAIRSYQNNATNTAAGVVDFAHGWYLPSPAQLSILYGQLPFIEAALAAAGGTTLTSNYYWCSAEVDGDNAWYVDYSNGRFYSGTKTASNRVRAVRSFTYAPADGVAYAWSDGSTSSSVTVLPTGTATWSVTATNGSCEASDTETVTKCATPCDAFAVRILGDTTECVTDSMTLYAMVPGATPPVAVGDILCTDNSIVKPGNWPVAGKTALGVVFHVDGTGLHGWAVHLNNQSTYISWGGYGTDIPDLPNYTSYRAALTDTAGYANTQTIRAFGDASTYHAAWAVDLDNGWYLPAAGQLRALYSELPTLNASLQIVGGTQFPMSGHWDYWSSTEYTSDVARRLTSTGYLDYNRKDNNSNVRSVRAF